MCEKFVDIAGDLLICDRNSLIKACELLINNEFVDKSAEFIDKWSKSVDKSEESLIFARIR